MGEEFEESDDATPIDASTAEPEDYFRDSLGESTVSLDPVHDVAPVKMMHALQGTIETLQTHAAQIAKNEKRITIEDTNGVLQPVVDAGGRHNVNSLILDVQSVVRSFDEKTQAQLEHAQAGADARRTVCQEAFAIPTQKPLDSFDSRTWHAWKAIHFSIVRHFPKPIWKMRVPFCHNQNKRNGKPFCFFQSESIFYL